MWFDLKMILKTWLLVIISILCPIIGVVVSVLQYQNSLIPK